LEEEIFFPGVENLDFLEKYSTSEENIQQSPRSELISQLLPVAISLMVLGFIGV
jgi:hypothetical protein